MTITQRKPIRPDDIIINEPGDQYSCDSCGCDLTHSVRIKCADPLCEPGDGVDICPPCFCAGREFRQHKRGPCIPRHRRELLLLKGIATQGFGNWKKIAEHIGTRSKEEVEKHYNEVYIDSQTWPIPKMDLQFDVDPVEFQARKRRRIQALNDTPPPPLKHGPVSLPGIHEIQGFFPGRLEFEHEIDNEAEDLVKDLEFGVCLEWGGDQIIEDEEDLDVRARAKWEEERRNPPPLAEKGRIPGKGPMINGINGYHPPSENGSVTRDSLPPKSDDALANGTSSGDGDEEVEEVTQPPPIETKESLAFKLSLLEMYSQRVDKRLEGKEVMFDRGLLDYKKMQASDKKRSREDRDIVHRLRPFAKLQTAADYEVFAADVLYEALLRQRIQELQQYRRLGLVTAADIDKYKSDLQKRTLIKANHRDYPSDKHQYRPGGRQSSGPDPRRASLVSFDSEGRKSNEREATPRLPGSSAGPVVRRMPAPLNLANSPSLHLLSTAEQVLCTQLRILPKPYLVVKETLVREYARRGGKLRRREARELVKIDVNKTSRVWDFLVQQGFLNIASDVSSNHASSSQDASTASGSQVNGSPVKDPRPLPSQQNGSALVPSTSSS
ncbi:uncharacterized protein EV420DRAFT_1619133 [Desarmillaria tabescens]|uniref:Transcriptional adapter 2 n=1 Tax=Armillaria tabescens TaxID=1929756 RepID=A0AA39TSW1_ARMTA|nr:uncharacterized protein EV420DRAFT_1619133 [Desarmillaria tabescens]KAK0462629.1 hypothetical protein EV420DRAFT_1619133 [Desarmillaria tabescens]